MKLSSILWAIVIIFLFNPSTAQQCPPGGAAFINEFSGSTIEEYIELVVLGDPSAPLAPVDLEGWIVDDNNIAQTGQGTASGHLILGSCFSAMAPGSIIVIYNPDAPAPGINPGWPNSDGAFVIPHSDGCITICSSNPNTGNDSYIPCGTASYQTWSLCIGLATGGDGPQVRDPFAQFYHGLYYDCNYGPAAETGCLEVGTIESSLDCGDWYDVSNYSQLSPTPGLANTALNQSLIDAITLGILDCDDINASCILFTCPTITAVEMIDAICADQDFMVDATGLADMGIIENTETDFGIEFVLFNGGTEPADPYTGGTSIGIVDYSGLTGSSPNQTASINTSISSPGTYQICAILTPPSAEPDCEPYACKTIEIYDNPTASLSGLHEFCPGDCHTLSVVINGGVEPYEANFLLGVGPINFPFNVPAYDINNQLRICYDAPGILPSYDSGSNTLHIPTFISGSGTIVLKNIVDDNGCSPDAISPDFTTLDFLDQPDISSAGPLEVCDDNMDGMALFDLTSLNNVLSGGSGATILWYSDPGGTILINNADSYYTSSVTVYAQIDDANCPSELEPVNLLVSTIDNPGTDTDVEICNEDNTILDLLFEIGGDPGGLWFDESSSGVNLADPGNVDFEGILPGTYLFSYTILAVGVCPETIAYLTVNVEGPANPGNDNEIGICVGSDVLVDLYDAIGPDYEFNGDWFDVEGSGVDLSDPSQVDFSGVSVGTWDFTYTIFSNTTCPDQFATLTVNIYEEPDAGTDNTVGICNQGETSVDLESALGPHDNIGYWSDDDDSGVELFPPHDVDFAGIDTGYYHFSYTIPETDNCPEVSAIVTVHVTSSLTAGENGTLSYCQGQKDTINLFDIILDESNDLGAWSQLSGVPVDLTDPTEVILNNTAIGIDSFLYELISDCGSDSSFVIIEIASGVQAGSDYTLSICQNTDTINLFDSLGIYDLGGTWVDGNLNILSNADSLFFSSIDTFYFQYILNDIGECGSDTALATIQIIPETVAGGDSSIFICAGTTGIYNLFDLIPGLSDSSGTWLQVSGEIIDLSAPDSLDLSTQGIGVDSIYYILDGACNSDSALVVIQVDDAPSAGLDYSIALCNSTLSINLYDSLLNYAAGGNWYDQDDIFITDPDDFILPGEGNYSFSYIIPESGACAADTAMAIITVEKEPYAGEDASLTVCEGSSTSINLFIELDSIPDPNGVWYDLDGSGLDLNNWDNLDFSSVSLGTFRFEYIVEPNGTVCEADTAEIVVSVSEFPNAGNSSDFSICDSPSLFINLDSLLSDHDSGGDWTDLDQVGVNLSNPAQVNFSNVNPGSYAFSYFIQAGNGCPPALATITVILLENPDAGPDLTISFCEGFDDPIDLFEPLNSSIEQTGDWTDPFGTGLNLSDPAMVDISALSPGNHVLEYQLSLDPQCGTDIAQLSINIEDASNTGICDTAYVCNGPSAAPLDFLFELQGEDAGGFFRELTDSGVDFSDPTSVSFEDILDGRYIFEYYFPAANGCPEVSTRIYVKVLKSNGLIIEANYCPDDSMVINGNIYNLDNPSGTEYLVNQEGCDSIVTIFIGPREIEFAGDHIDANCFDLGEISITGVTGTGFPVWISNDDLGIVEVNELPLVMEDLSAGSYELSLFNEKSCRYDSTIEIQSFEGFLFEIPGDITIQSGQSYTIDLVTDLNPVSIEWFPATGLDCSDCLSPVASPITDTEYTVTLIDADGCILTGSIMIRVEANNDVYLPNVFSPNGDEHNPYFYVQSNNSSGFYSMTIFNRWGEKLYHGEGLQLNDANAGWDGRYKDKLLQPGVYVYLIEVDFGNEPPLMLSGDILLLR